MARVLTPQDGYVIMNDLVKQATGQENIKVTDLSSFVSAGEKVLATGMENVFNSLNIVSDFKMFEVARSEVSYMFTNLLEPSVNKYYYYCINKIKKDEVVTLLD